MSEKKHKGGYELLKEKYAKLEAENKELRAAAEKSQTAYLELSRTFKENIKKVEDNRDEWKEKFERKSSPIISACEKLSSDLVKKEERLAFLLDHCPFWVRWMYRKQFEKGGK